MPSFRQPIRHCVLGAVSLAAMAVAAPALAAAEPRYTIDLPAEPLGAALRDLAAMTHRNILAASARTDGKLAPAISGRLTLAEALARLLAGSGLHAVASDEGFVIEPTGEGRAEAEPSTITVTGTRIAGAVIADPVITINQTTMREAGQTSLGQAILALPQNFGGGQNPGIGLNVPEASGSSLGGGSGLNLRGAGGDATLTLLDGQRLSYIATYQSIDIGAIPLGLVDHLEIVPDGASALYGSDAVAGVANVILRHDYEGLATSARFGASTDSGNQQQQYDLTTGHRWNGGGIIVAYDFEKDTAILARQRSYAAAQTPGLTLYPAMEHHSAGLSGHQDLGSGITFALDALYNWRRSQSAYALTASGDVMASGGDATSHDSAFALAPSLKGHIGAWNWTLEGSYGQDHATYANHGYYQGQVLYTTGGCYCNSALAGEIGLEGPLFALPGGEARLAIGGGARDNRFHGYATAGTAQDIQASQQDYYGYAELSLPLVSPLLHLPALYRLNLTGALRYENYPGIADVVTPKLGLVYAPSADLDIKGAWGRSFRAPTLYEQYAGAGTYLVSASAIGGSQFPASATALVATGGNPDLKPERAESWSATLAIHPRELAGLHLEVTYFNIHYRDRIVTPIPTFGNALGNPVYSDLVNTAPSLAEVAALTSNAATFFNEVSGPFNPANVGAIVNDVNLNAASQIIDGIDMSGRYHLDWGKSRSLDVTLSATRLNSREKLSALQPWIALAGTIFNPPHWRWRGGVVWNAPAVTLTSYVTYSGGITDTRSATPTGIAAMTTWDLTGIYRLPALHGPLHGVDLTLSAANLLNAKPGQIAGQIYETPYDSTNASPFGRVISLTVSKSW